MTTHQVVIKAHRHKKLQSGRYLKLVIDGTFNPFLDE